MLNPSDKEIDRLSREAAEQYEPDDSGLSWSKFEQRLGARLPDKPPGNWSALRIRPVAWGSVILAVTGLTYFLIKSEKYNKNSTLSNLNQTTVSQARTSRKPVRPSDSTTSAFSAGTAKNINRDQKDPATGKLLPGPTVSTAAAPSNAAPLTSVNRNSGIPNISLNNVDASHKHHTILNAHTVSRKNFSDGSGLSDDEVDQQDAIASGAAGQQKKPGVANSSKSDGAAVPFVRDAAEVSLPSLANTRFGGGRISGHDSLQNRFPVNSRTNPSNARTHASINRSLVVGVVIGPDYTNAGGVTNDQLSNNLGITLGYYLTNRLSVNTGLIYSKKYYWSTGKGFQMPGYWPNSFPIEAVNGDCNMWEIPLTVRYDFPSHGKTNFFVDAGVSSFLMRKETYTLFYHNGNRFFGKTFENDRHSSFLFSSASISAGVERDLSHGISFQVEPFLKIPIGGVGTGNVKLSSYGLLFTFRYAPVLGRARK